MFNKMLAFLMLITIGLNTISGQSDGSDIFDTLLNRSKRAQMTVCIELTPRGPQEVPYIMCQNAKNSQKQPQLLGESVETSPKSELFENSMYNRNNPNNLRDHSHNQNDAQQLQQNAQRFQQSTFPKSPTFQQSQRQQQQLLGNIQQKDGRPIQTSISNEKSYPNVPENYQRITPNTNQAYNEQEAFPFNTQSIANFRTTTYTPEPPSAYYRIRVDATDTPKRNEQSQLFQQSNEYTTTPYQSQQSTIASDNRERANARQSITRPLQVTNVEKSIYVPTVSITNAPTTSTPSEAVTIATPTYTTMVPTVNKSTKPAINQREGLPQLAEQSLKTAPIVSAQRVRYNSNERDGYRLGDPFILPHEFQIVDIEPTLQLPGMLPMTDVLSRTVPASNLQQIQQILQSQNDRLQQFRMPSTQQLPNTLHMPNTVQFPNTAPSAFRLPNSVQLPNSAPSAFRLPNNQQPLSNSFNLLGAMQLSNARQITDSLGAFSTPRTPTLLSSVLLPNAASQAWKAPPPSQTTFSHSLPSEVPHISTSHAPPLHTPLSTNTSQLTNAMQAPNQSQNIEIRQKTPQNVFPAHVQIPNVPKAQPQASRVLQNSAILQPSNIARSLELFDDPIMQQFYETLNDKTLGFPMHGNVLINEPLLSLNAASKYNKATMKAKAYASPSVANTCPTPPPYIPPIAEYSPSPTYAPAPSVTPKQCAKSCASSDSNHQPIVIALPCCNQQMSIPYGNNFPLSMGGLVNPFSNFVSAAHATMAPIGLPSPLAPLLSSTFPNFGLPNTQTNMVGAANPYPQYYNAPSIQSAQSRTQQTPQIPQIPQQSIQPAQPIQHIQQLQPAQPMQHIQQLQPAQPMQHIQQLQPAQPMQTLQHMKPIQPIQPTQPMQPLHPLQTAQPMQPMQPIQTQQQIPTIARTAPVNINNLPPASQATVQTSNEPFLQSTRTLSPSNNVQQSTPSNKQQILTATRFTENTSELPKTTTTLSTTVNTTITTPIVTTAKLGKDEITENLGVESKKTYKTLINAAKVLSALSTNQGTENMPESDEDRENESVSTISPLYQRKY